MYQAQEAQRLIDLNKATFQSAAHSLDLFQDQAEQFAELWMNQTLQLPSQLQKACFDWFKLCKRERNNYKNMMDQGFKRVEEFVQGAESAQQAEPTPQAEKEETAKKSEAKTKSK